MRSHWGRDRQKGKGLAKKMLSGMEQRFTMLNLPVVSALRCQDSLPDPCDLFCHPIQEQWKSHNQHIKPSHTLLSSMTRLSELMGWLYMRCDNQPIKPSYMLLSSMARALRAHGVALHALCRRSAPSCIDHSMSSRLLVLSKRDVVAQSYGNCRVLSITWVAGCCGVPV